MVVEGLGIPSLFLMEILADRTRSQKILRPNKGGAFISLAQRDKGSVLCGARSGSQTREFSL
jgi:hypothetical protein